MRGQPTELIRSALYDAAMIELSAFEKLPDTEHIFSSDFDKKIAELTNRKERKATVIIPLKRRVIAVIVAIAMLISMTVTAVAFGEEIKDFIVEVYEKFTKFYVKGDNYRKGDLKEIYSFSWVPEGYVLTDFDTEGPMSVIAWENGESFIELTQYYATTGSQTINSENAYHEVFMIDNRKIYYYEVKGTFGVTWVENEYTFSIIAYPSGENNRELIESLIDGMYVISEEQEE